MTRKLEKQKTQKQLEYFFLLLHNSCVDIPPLLHSSVASSVRTSVAGITFEMKRQTSVRRPRNILCKLQDFKGDREKSGQSGMAGLGHPERTSTSPAAGPGLPPKRWVKPLQT